MTYYSLLFDHHDHTYHLADFTSLEDANKAFLVEVEKFKADPAGYTDDDPSTWNDEYFPHLEIIKCDDEDNILDDINAFSTFCGFDKEPV